MAMHNVDDILYNKLPTQEETKQQDAISNVSDVTDVTDISDKVDKPELDINNEEKLTYIEQFKKDKQEVLESREQELTDKPIEKSEKSQDTDEYGNEIPKKRVYTEEEVQAMIQRRLKNHYAEKQQPQAVQQPTQQQVQQVAQEFTADPNSEDSWETQLKHFVKQTFQELNQESVHSQRLAQQQREMADFQAKFSMGIDKYNDFIDVVSDKPMTDGMTMALKGMSDPAAFVYAAAKQQPKELERISKLSDPFQQAAEMGRLEERMRKARKVSSAPKPATKTRSDISSTFDETPSIDSRIMNDAKRKLGRLK